MAGETRLDHIRAQIAAAKAVVGKEYVLFSVAAVHFPDAEFLLSLVDNLAVALRSVEWTPDGQGEQACPWCGEYKNRHMPECQRQRVLARLAEDAGAAP